jgi:hypothetical protein
MKSCLLVSGARSELSDLVDAEVVIAETCQNRNLTRPTVPHTSTTPSWRTAIVHWAAQGWSSLKIEYLMTLTQRIPPLEVPGMKVHLRRAS